MILFYSKCNLSIHFVWNVISKTIFNLLNGWKLKLKSIIWIFYRISSILMVQPHWRACVGLLDANVEFKRDMMSFTNAIGNYHQFACWTNQFQFQISCEIVMGERKCDAFALFVNCIVCPTFRAYFGFDHRKCIYVCCPIWWKMTWTEIPNSKQKKKNEQHLISKWIRCTIFGMGKDAKNVLKMGSSSVFPLEFLIFTNRKS